MKQGTQTVADILIHTEVYGVHGVAECYFEGETLRKEERNIALALSELIKQLEGKKAVGRRWRTEDGLNGLVGASTKKRRRKSVAEMDTFVLVGGKMRSL